MINFQSPNRERDTCFQVTAKREMRDIALVPGTPTTYIIKMIVCAVKIH